MSKLYGTISGDGRSKSNATQCATNHIRATAQSWQGSIGVTIDILPDGKHVFSVEFGEGSTAHPSTVLIAQGEFADGKLRVTHVTSTDLELALTH